MHPKKHLLCPLRLRAIPSQFSWVDQRLFKEGRCSPCKSEALALYLFLLTVSDSQGLSYYGDVSLSRILHLDAHQVCAARQQLIDCHLVAYQKPLCQVLSLDLDSHETSGPRVGTAISTGDLLRKILGGAA